MTVSIPIKEKLLNIRMRSGNYCHNGSVPVLWKLGDVLSERVQLVLSQNAIAPSSPDDLVGGLPNVRRLG